MPRQVWILSTADTCSEPKTLDDSKTPLNLTEPKGAKTSLWFTVWFYASGTFCLALEALNYQ